MPKEVLVDDPAKVQTIGEASQVLTLEGDDRTLSLEAVLQPEIQDRFQPCDKKIFTALVSRNVFWVKFKVTQIINEDIWLHIESAHIRELDLYLVDSRGKLVDELHTGVSRDLENKAVDLNTFFFPLQQRDQTGEYTCYIRVISLMSLELPFRVGTFEELTNQNVIAQGLAMAFLGLMLMMILYNAFLYGLIKEKIYLLYTIHLVLAMVSVLFISNHIIFRDYAPTLWMHDNFAFWVTANYISTNVFSIHYLRLKSNLRWVYLLLLWTIPVFILIATLGLFFPTKMIIPGQILSVIDGLAILGAAYYLLFNHKAPNIAFTLGYTAGIISLIVTGGVL